MVNIINIVDIKKVTELTAFFYFIFMNFMSYTIMLNLFTMVTLQQYDDFTAKEENPIDKFSDMMNSFKIAWNKYCKDGNDGYTTKASNLKYLLLSLNGELSVGYKKDFNAIMKYISDLNLRV